MSEQHVTEAEKPCIADAPKPKSLGQVGYEAMLTALHVPHEIAVLGSEALKAHQWSMQWEQQPDYVHAAWEVIGLACAQAYLKTMVAPSLGVKL